jgi:two-component system chemotaxis sensor kinase CheA
MSTKKRVKFPIKFKLLSFVVALIIASVGGFALYAAGVLKNEKYIAVYENSANKIESYGKNIEDKLLSIINLGFNVESTWQVMPKNAQKLINGNDDFVLWGKIKDGELIQYIQNKNLNIDIYSAKKNNEIKKKILEFTSKKYEKNALFTFEVIDGNPLFIFFYDSLESNAMNFSVVQMPELIGQMESDALDRYYLLRGKSNVLYRSKDGSNLESVLETREINNSGAFQAKIDESEYLVSFYTNSRFNLKLISFVSVDKAYEVIDNLVIKCFSYAAIVLGLGLIVSLIISNSLTRPITLLYEGTKAFARRDFLKKIEVETNDEIAHLALSFNEMGSEISALLEEKQLMIDELEDLNQNLELKVEQRVKELKEAHDFISAMVNSLNEGLFVFDDKGKCNELFTKACDDLFENTPKDNLVANVLKVEKEGSLDNWIRMMFEEPIPFEEVANLGPRKIEEGEGESFKSIDINYLPMRNEQEKVTNVVCVGTDVTSKVLAEKSFKQSELFVHKVTKIVKEKSFFIKTIEALNGVVQRIEKETNLTLEEYKRDLHTIKGSALMCSMNNLGDLVHVYEDNLANDSSLFESRLKFVPEIKKTLMVEINEIKEFLGDEFIDKKKRSVMLYEDILKFYNAISDKQAKETFYNNYVCENLVDYLRSYDIVITNVAKEEGKIINPIKFNVEKAPVEIGPIKEILSTFVHIFSNCAAHGIESASVREEREKVSGGTIAVDIKLPIAEYLEIKISDDGGGINIDKLREKLGDVGKKLSEKEILHSIFNDGISTRDQATDVAGRGVGMSAVKQEIEKAGGSIEVESTLGQGSTFYISIPMSLNSKHA